VQRVVVATQSVKHGLLERRLITNDVVRLTVLRDWRRGRCSGNDLGDLLASRLGTNVERRRLREKIDTLCQFKVLEVR
jgi:hypothetical protein